MFKKYCFGLWDTMIHKTSEVERHLTDLGLFIIVTFPIFYIVNKLIFGIKGYESFFLRLSIGILGMLLVARRYLPFQLKKLMPLVYYGTLLYAFPFFFFFMFFQNPHSFIWMVNVLSGLFFLSFFLNWKEYLVFSLSGFFLAWLVFWLSNPNPQLPPNFMSLAINYVNPVVYLALFSNKKDNIIQQKLRTMKMVAGSIAHELRTPLSAMMMDAKVLSKFFPSYQDAYAQAKEAQLPVQNITPQQQVNLGKIPQSLEKVSRNAHTMITMLLTNLNEGTADRRIEVCSMTNCVEEALNTYPFSPDERRLIHWEDTREDKKDFSFLGHKELTKHVLFNLLKNALYAIASAGSGEIFITIEPSTTKKGKNRLVFKDTGPGIPPENMRHIFDRFYTKTEHGTGIGLAFCQSVIQGFDGDITVKSIKGKYTAFTLSLPIFVDDAPSREL